MVSKLMIHNKELNIADVIIQSVFSDQTLQRSSDIP